MAGTPSGSIEHFIASSTQSGSMDAFVAIVKEFDRVGNNLTRIASNFGTAGTGFDYSFQANPPGENAWAVWSKAAAAGTYYIAVQWSYNNVFGAAPGNPGDVPTDFAVGIQMAYDTTGTSPWNGGTANAGADAKGTPVWVANGGNLVVHPRSNGTSGTFATNLEASVQAYQWGAANNRLQIVMDDDYVWIGHSEGSSPASYNRMLYMGPYTAAAGVSPVVPLCMYQTDQNVNLDTDVGTLTNADMANEGGITEATAATTSKTARVTALEDLLVATLQPNPQRASPTFDGFAVPIYVRDANGAGAYGLLGTIDLMRMTSDVASHDTNTGMTKVFLGSNVIGTRKLVVDWDGATVPGSGATVPGIQF